MHPLYGVTVNSTTEQLESEAPLATDSIAALDKYVVDLMLRGAKPSEIQIRVLRFTNAPMQMWEV